ncbi:MAG: methionine gamma-lyase family protein, partial [Selenomonadaceae bacterium]|nr:methionine gamma-lyase family protein [Selenomonadaceae bacterium]
MFSEKLLKLKEEVLIEVRPYFERLRETEEKNSLKVLNAMRKAKVSDAHFGISSGYAYNDIGRSKLEEVYAKVFHAERALVRPQFVSGTHALATVLFGCLRPGDKLVSVTGSPYDTMQTVIGHAVKSKGSLKEFGVEYDELPMVGGKVDISGVKNIVDEKTKMVLIQRSRGYSDREPIFISEMEKIIDEIKTYAPKCIVFVDNCYGEFVEEKEPIEV